MALGFGDELFPPNHPEVSDSGYMYTVTDGNKIIGSTITPSGTVIGNYPAMTDADQTTYGGLSRTSSGTSYLTFDMLRKINNAVVTIYYSVVNGGSAGTRTASFEISDDDTNYSEVSTVSETSTSSESFKNYSGQISFRYIRMKLTSASGGNYNGQIYFIRVEKS